MHVSARISSKAELSPKHYFNCASTIKRFKHLDQLFHTIWQQSEPWGLDCMPTDYLSIPLPSATTFKSSENRSNPLNRIASPSLSWIRVLFYQKCQRRSRSCWEEFKFKTITFYLAGGDHMFLKLDRLPLVVGRLMIKTKIFRYTRLCIEIVGTKSLLVKDCLGRYFPYKLGRSWMMGLQ